MTIDDFSMEQDANPSLIVAVDDLVSNVIAVFADEGTEVGELSIVRLSDGLYQLTVRTHGDLARYARWTWNRGEVQEIE